jgi:putative PIG3 family NAD(P)H quinone oxidoreductase
MKQVEIGPARDEASLHLVDAPVPEARAGEILIRVAHAGVNRPDLLQRAGHYPPPPDASPVMGLEVAGHIEALGPGVSDWRVGDAVCALTPGGGYAEFCRVPAGQVLPVPKGLSLAEAAALPEVWFTVWANVADIGRLAAGERALVHGGSSGIGLAAIAMCRLKGAECIVTVGDAEKARFCLDYGASAAINYRSEDFAARVKELTAGSGVDLVLDMIGGDYIAPNLSVLRRDGRLVLIGFQHGTKAEIDFNAVLRQRLVITGSAMRPRTVAEKTRIRDALLAEVWPALAAGKVRTHIHARFPLSGVGEAHRLMQSSRHVGKIVLDVAAG